MPELGGKTTLEQCLSEARIAGFSGIESGGKFPKDPSKLIPKLEKEKLSLCSGCYGANLLKNTPQEEMELMTEQLDLFIKCGAPCGFAEVTGSIQSDPKTPLSKRPILNNEDWKLLIKRINEISKMMMDRGMPLAYHHHMGTVIETQKDTERLMDNTIDEVKLLIDTGHMLFAGGDSIKLLEDYYQNLFMFTLKILEKKF